MNIYKITIRWPKRVTVQYWFLTVQLWFYTVQLWFYTVQFQFLHSPVLIFTQSSFIFLHSPVLIFTQSSFIFFTQSSFIFCVVTRPLSLYCNKRYLTAVILYFLATMDSIIRQVVQEELRRSNSSRPETASSTNQDDQGRSENESGAAGSSRSSFSSRTVGRLGCF